ncbi:Tyrosine-protein phosphatase CpsB [bioreactor metagenome]|jgi:protein-tyrosine phosphatase|uniref:Tyrosine-protein phosphatase CpsB n=1 Tax=bioreactor metagenome TaxID=1076179 RepID=A0A645DGL2_9ZZZZ|nr:CpsB/CapC family capsule biosynthesis tyrosine phosphatase [Sphaerochaeta sp.]
MGVSDLHCHLLPEIDDGYVSVEQFSRMLNLYAESGITTIAFTPHIYNPYVTTDVAKLRSTYQWAKELASSLGLVTYLGSELYVGEQDELKSLPIAARYALVEFGLSLPPPRLFERLSGLQKQSLTPILAHVERYRWLDPKSPLLVQLKQMGCLLQSNVEAVENGDALPYLRHDLIDIIATDNHGDETLPVRLVQTLSDWPQVAQRMENLW